MTFKKGLALCTNINLLHYRTCLLPMKPREIPCAYTKKLVWYDWKAHTHTHTHTLIQKRNKNARITPVWFQNSAVQRHDFHNISAWVIFKKITVEHTWSKVKKWSLENKVVKRLKIPRISSTRSAIDMSFGKIPPCMHAQIQQIEIYSPLDPPIY